MKSQISALAYVLQGQGVTDPDTPGSKGGGGGGVLWSRKEGGRDRDPSLGRVVAYCQAGEYRGRDQRGIKCGMCDMCGIWALNIRIYSPLARKKPGSQKREEGLEKSTEGQVGSPTLFLN